MWVIAGLMAWPLVEIALIVWIGGKIGVWATLAWVLLTGGLGVMLMRLAALRGAVRLREGLTAMRSPGPGIAAGMFGLLAGWLLFLPGFLGDVAGLLLLLPPVQTMISRAILSRAIIVTQGAARGQTVDGDWEEVRSADPDRRSLPPRPSGWTQD